MMHIRAENKRVGTCFIVECENYKMAGSSNRGYVGTIVYGVRGNQWVENRGKWVTEKLIFTTDEHDITVVYPTGIKNLPESIPYTPPSFRKA